ncbi:MAG: LytR/AlgR family response regulator transcription factor [Enterocloster sp.]
MNIAIIDDSMEDARHLSRHIAAYSQNTRICQQTEIFTSTANFLHSWKPGMFDLIFVDIFFGNDTEGLRIAEHIRKEDIFCTLIFTTVSPDYALKGYEVRALDYMVKPVSYESVCRILDYYRTIIFKKNLHYIEVKESRIMVKIPVDDIFYTDYFNHYIQIHLSDKTIRTYMRFDDFSGMLLCFPQFICCYRNCIINMDKVAALEKAEFIITTGERLPITRSLRPQIHQQYADYQFRKLNGGIG